MGRSVWTHSSAAATVFTCLEPMHICPECENETTEPECCGVFLDPDGEDARFEFECLVDNIREAFTSRFPSMAECDHWPERESHAIVENGQCMIVISEYCGLVSIGAVPLGEASYDCDTTGLARQWTEKNAVPVLQQFETLRNVGYFGNGEGVFRRVAA